MQNNKVDKENIDLDILYKKVEKFFKPLFLKNGNDVLLNCLDEDYPFIVRLLDTYTDAKEGVKCGTTIHSLDGYINTYLYVISGSITIDQYKNDFCSGYINDFKASVNQGYYFSSDKDFNLIFSPNTKVLVIQTVKKNKYAELDANVMQMLGGPVESKGRLNYIDGCTDSLLIPPFIKGMGCLNYLHFPKGINQTSHTHPTHRIGVIIKGSGECITPLGNVPLTKGMIFQIPKEGKENLFIKGNGFESHKGPFIAGTHSFKTTDSEMDVIAFHPDSDFGPEHHIHPMINRTLVDGVAASNLKEIQSKVYNTKNN